VVWKDHLIEVALGILFSQKLLSKSKYSKEDIRGSVTNITYKKKGKERKRIWLLWIIGRFWKRSGEEGAL
jgi:hypothetical protein